MVFSELLKKAPLAGAFFVSAIYAFAAQAQCPVPANIEQSSVTRVVDGDTVRLKDGRSVRLIGINAPELASRGRSDEPFAQAARLRLQALVDADGGRVGLAVGNPSRDRYGRTLAHLYDARNGSLEARLLSEGLGYQVVFAPGDDWVACLAAAERSARDSGQGLWRRSVVLTPGSITRSGFALVRARLSSVERNRGGLWLELAGGLVARVDPAQLRDFDEAALRRMQGQEVEVRGWIIDRSRKGVSSGQARWMLPLTHPAMIRLSPRD